MAAVWTRARGLRLDKLVIVQGRSLEHQTGDDTRKRRALRTQKGLFDPTPRPSPHQEINDQKVSYVDKKIETSMNIAISSGIMTT